MVRKVASPARSSVDRLEPEALRPQNRSSASLPPVSTGAVGSFSAPCALAFRLAAAIPSPTFSPCHARRLRNAYAILAMGGARLIHICRTRETMPSITPGRLLLIMLTLWGLFMIVPDLFRVVQPLG